MAAGDVILEVSGLTANIGDKPILKGMDFKVRKGEVHAIMGPNGSGKSTFSKVIVGHPAYEVSATAAARLQPYPRLARQRMQPARETAQAVPAQPHLPRPHPGLMPRHARLPPLVSRLR
jgi:ABC-type multidrug transport system ATPase subunit